MALEYNLTFTHDEMTTLRAACSTYQKNRLAEEATALEMNEERIAAFFAKQAGRADLLYSKIVAEHDRDEPRP